MFIKFDESKPGVVLWDSFKEPTVISDRNGWEKNLHFYRRK